MEIKTAGRLILASASPRRMEMLKLLGLDFEVLPSGIKETSRTGETPEEHVLRLSAQKVFALSSSYPEAWVIGADTVVVLDGGFMGKPATIAEAKKMLKKLSGREHQVYTGFAIARKITDILLLEAVISSVFFKRLSEEEVNWYVGTDEPYDKAGGYALQGRGAFFISRITGSYTNVIGLPLCEAVNLLKSAGAIEFPR
ncbi:MAG: nucleoside triphosphate pyrophosphatase [Syntrophales bacterium]|nr:nucleoside triphosphate pyrophosphatase [Syntrophales bacterium]